MGDSKKKKRSPILFFFAAFFAIVIVMFVTNWKSVLVEEIRFPFNNGVAGLSTYKNWLVAVSLDDKIYVWDWDDLSKKQKEGSVLSGQAALLDSDLVISLRQQNPHALVVTNLQGDKEYKEILVDSNNKRARLGISRDRSTVAVILAETQDNQTTQASYELLTVDLDAGRTYPVITIKQKQAQSNWTDLAISTDGKFAAIAGGKNGHGWILVIDTQKKQVVWERELPDVKLVFHVAFSLDNQTVYARASDSALHRFEGKSGKELVPWLAGKKNKSTLKHSSAQIVAVSPDGHLVAAVVGGTVYLWDCKTGEKVFGKAPGHKIESGVAFSPDSRFLATSDMRQGGTIKIWRMPED